jgi:tetraacyldisaccharide 4'-kinase
MEVLLVCGIANPGPLKTYLEAETASYEVLSFNDHHIFSIDDLKAMRKRFEAMPSGKKILLTTEKDGVRLLKFHKELGSLPLFVLPVRHRILFGEREDFHTSILTFIEKFYHVEKKEEHRHHL